MALYKRIISLAFKMTQLIKRNFQDMTIKHDL